MSEIFAVASGTWRRILRMWVVYLLIVCVYVLIASAYNYYWLSLGRNRELMINVSLVLNSIAAMIVAISLTYEIPQELNSGIASTLLAKPLGRTQYLLGKLTGIVITGLVITGLITLGFAFIYAFFFDKPQMPMMQGHLMVMASVIPLSAIALLFSTVLPETIAAIVTAMAFFLSHFTAKINHVAYVYGGILPDLNLFNLKAEAEMGGAVDPDYMGLALLWGIVFAVVLSALSSIIFSYRDLK